MRPRYPAQVVEQILAAARGRRIVELGAGTGILTRALLQDEGSAGSSARGAAGGSADGAAEPCVERVEAVEPSATMAAVLRQRSAADLTHGRLRVHPTTAEATGLPNACAETVVASQAWHWFETAVVSREIHRLLAPGGSLVIVSNHLDTTDPWVHRLTRIMRAGDIYRPGSAPVLHPRLFDPPQTTEVRWMREITTEGIRRLSTTLSSWLAAGPKDRERRRENLQWYLAKHSGLGSEDTVHLPYITVLHQARRLC